MQIKQSVLVRLGMGVVIAALVFSALAWLNTMILVALCWLSALWIAWEWGKLCDSGLKIWIYPVALQLLIVPILIWHGDKNAFLLTLLSVAALWWFVMFIVISSYQSDWKKALWLSVLYRGGAIISIGATLAVVLFLVHTSQRSWLIYLLAVVALVDTSAYVCGNLFGGKKLMPEISPKKTYAGLWGALIVILIVSIPISFVFETSMLERLDFVLMSLVIVLFCVVGDFSESLLKRRAGVKDSGRLLPGHGGLLDRTDSFLAAAPIFLLLHWL